jgi:D-glycerate 3-kinase
MLRKLPVLRFFSIIKLTSIFRIIMFQELLTKLSENQQLNEDELNYLLELEFQNQDKAKALGVNAHNGRNEIQRRSALFPLVLPEVIAVQEEIGLEYNPKINQYLWELWLPLAIKFLRQKWLLDRPLIQGILGFQGTGKTTLSQIIGIILNRIGYHTIGLSLDDFYLTYQERQQLQQIDPRLIWRGPPGTHDLDLAKKTLDQLRQKNKNEQILVPHFDKSAHEGKGDRVGLIPIDHPEIILFEGWFVGVRPIDPQKFQNPPAPINTPEDQKFAQYLNQKLASYLPIWEYIDNLVVLVPEDYRYSKQWRKDAENQMIASGKPGMNETEIDQFIDYFWKALHPELFITPLLEDPELVDCVIQIKANHEYARIYQSEFQFLSDQAEYLRY